MKTIKDIETIKKLLAPVFQKNNVIKAVVFGSTSKGSETRKSDLDLMIIKDTRKRFFDRYDEFDEIFELIKDRAIDILIYTPEELESISHRSFIKMIINTGKPIYEH
jgi:predicted nucleotidyltransferase